MSEAKRKLEKRKEKLLSCAGVQTMAGKVQVRWETESCSDADGSAGLLHPVSASDGAVVTVAGRLSTDIQEPERPVDRGRSGAHGCCPFCRVTGAIRTSRRSAAMG